MAKMLPELKSSPVIHRYQDGAPVLSKRDIPYEADCIFNCGVIKYHGQYVCAFRTRIIFAGMMITSESSRAMMSVLILVKYITLS